MNVQQHTIPLFSRTGCLLSPDTPVRCMCSTSGWRCLGARGTGRGAFVHRRGRFHGCRDVLRAVQRQGTALRLSSLLCLLRRTPTHPTGVKPDLSRRGSAHRPERRRLRKEAGRIRSQRKTRNYDPQCMKAMTTEKGGVARETLCLCCVSLCVCHRLIHEIPPIFKVFYACQFNITELWLG